MDEMTTFVENQSPVRVLTIASDNCGIDKSTNPIQIAIALSGLRKHGLLDTSPLLDYVDAMLDLTPAYRLSYPAGCSIEAGMFAWSDINTPGWQHKFFVGRSVSLETRSVS